MRIIVYKGGAQYNAMNRFSEQLAEGFISWGHEVDVIDLLKLKEDHGVALKAALQKKPNLAIGFNGQGSELHTPDNKSIYEMDACHYLGLLLDHPAFHAGRVVRSATPAIFGVVDLTHIDYLKDVVPQHPVFFAPHGGIQSPDFKNNERPIDILFCGTGMDAEKERQDWLLYPTSYQSILEEAYAEFLKQPQAWENLIIQGATKRHLYIPANIMAAMIVQLEIVMRADYRLKILKALDKAGVKVTIMGNGWEYAKFKHHELHPSVEFYDALKLICKSKIALNASPQYFTGTHERVFASMLNGAVAVTSNSQYYRKHFKETEHYIGYDLKTLPETIDTMRELLETPKELNEIRQSALKIAMRDHTWKSRAHEFLDKFQTLALCQHLYKKQWF